MVLYSEKIHFKETKLLGTRLWIWEKKRKKKPTSEVSRAGFTPFFAIFFPQRSLVPGYEGRDFSVGQEHSLS